MLHRALALSLLSGRPAGPCGSFAPIREVAHDLNEPDFVKPMDPQTATLAENLKKP